MQKSKITSNIEDYLEAIYRIELKRGVVRVKEISQALGVTYPSTSGILKKMEKMDLVEHERYGYVKLTESGGEIAQDIVRREDVMNALLRTMLKLPEEKAIDIACKMEHFLDHETTVRLELLMEFALNGGSRSFISRFHTYLEEKLNTPEITE